jgi:tetratricopeptide (TPR) repeat protein
MRAALALEALYGTASDRATALAYHWGRAGDARKEAHYVTLSGEQALHIGAYHEAISYFRRALAFVSPADPAIRRIRLTQRLGEAHLGLGAYIEAQELYREILSLAEREREETARAEILYSLGEIAYAQRQYDEARALFEACRALFETLGDDAAVARALNSLGNVAEEIGEAELAQALYRQSFALTREVDSTRQILNINDGSSRLYDMAEMARLILQLSAQEEDGDVRGAAETLYQIGEIANEKKDYENARLYFIRAIRAASAQGNTDLALNCLMGLVQIFNHDGQRERALQLLAFILHYPESSENLQDGAERIAFELQSALPSDISESVWEQGKNSHIDDIVRDILAQWSED